MTTSTQQHDFRIEPLIAIIIIVVVVVIIIIITVLVIVLTEKGTLAVAVKHPGR